MIHSGSSPLTRGKPHSSSCRFTARGLIPAHAGKTVEHDVARAEVRAHPRSRGENLRDHIDLGQVAGSSPLTRGKRGARDHGPDARRLIPAHAGKTRLASTRPCAPAAHPRSRGENTWRRGLLAHRCGSSPLTRGKPDVVISTPNGPRLIPAHAGKTSIILGPLTHFKAHPRSRGENLWYDAVAEHPEGSSPLTRGKPGAYSRGL